MQQPGDMANPQVVGVQQQNRLSLAERLRKYGLDQDQSGAQSFSDSFNQQMMYGRRPQDEAAQATPESNQSILDKYYSSPDSSAGYTPDDGAQQRRSIMNRAAKKPAGMFAGAGDAISRGASGAGSAISKGFGSAAAGFGRLFA